MWVVKIEWLRTWQTLLERHEERQRARQDRDHHRRGTGGVAVHVDGGGLLAGDGGAGDGEARHRRAAFDGSPPRGPEVADPIPQRSFPKQANLQPAVIPHGSRCPAQSHRIRRQVEQLDVRGLVDVAGVVAQRQDRPVPLSQ